MSGDSNVGLGMVPHKKSCKCDECTIERQVKQIEQLQAYKEKVEALVRYAKKPINVDAMQSVIREMEVLVMKDLG